MKSKRKSLIVMFNQIFNDICIRLFTNFAHIAIVNSVCGSYEETITRNGHKEKLKFVQNIALSWFGFFFV